MPAHPPPIPRKEKVLKGYVYQPYFLYRILHEHAKDLEEEIATVHNQMRIAKHNRELVESIQHYLNGEQNGNDASRHDDRHHNHGGRSSN